MESTDLKNVPSHVENIIIKGHKHTNDEYIRRNLGNEQLFKAANFEEILTQAELVRRNLLKLNCFKSVEVLVDSSPTKANYYKVIFSVDEVRSFGGSVQSSVGNNEGSINTAVNLPNLFGNGEKVSAEYSYGTRNHTDSRLSYSSPINLNPNKHFTVSLFQSANDFPWSKYNQKDNGITVDIVSPFRFSVSKKSEVKGVHGITYEGVWRQLNSYLDSSFDVREQSGHSLKSSFKYTNIIDRRDNSVLPTIGGSLRTTAELAGFGGDVRFFRFNSDYTYTRTFFNYFTTQLSFSKGFAMPLKKEEKILITDKFFLGGPLGLRGFTNRGAGPHKEDCSLGNDAYWLAAAHLYTPLPFLHKHEKLSAWLKTHSFVNIGNLFSPNKLLSNDENRLQCLIKNARLSVGTGLVLAFGSTARVELNYVWPLWKCENDKTIDGFQFGIGINFN